MNVTITNTQKVRATISATKSDGSAASIQSIAWGVSSGDGTVQQVDNTSADLISGATIGDTQIVANVTSDFGGGVITVPFNITMTVSPVALPAGASISVAFGTPQPK